VGLFDLDFPLDFPLAGLFSSWRYRSMSGLFDLPLDTPAVFFETDFPERYPLFPFFFFFLFKSITA